MTKIKIPTKPKRRFLSEDLVIDSWKKIEYFFEELLNRNISNITELEDWMLDRSKLEAVLEEDMAWRYIKMNIDTTDKELSKRFHFWIQEISPKSAPYSHKLNLKFKDTYLLKIIISRYIFIICKICLINILYLS